jgi:hypothetical protein
MLFQDKVCIDPLGNKCADMQFLSLYAAQGLGNQFDGILGLSNHHQEGKNNLNFV